MRARAGTEASARLKPSKEALQAAQRGTAPAPPAPRIPLPRPGRDSTADFLRGAAVRWVGMLPPPQSSPSPMLPFGVRRGRETKVGSQSRSGQSPPFPCPDGLSPHLALLTPPPSRTCVSRPSLGPWTWELFHVLSRKGLLAGTPTLPAPSPEIEQRQRSRRGARFAPAQRPPNTHPFLTPPLRHQGKWLPSTPSPPPPSWPTPCNLGQQRGLFCWPWPRSPTAPRAPFFLAVFLSTLGALFAMFLCAVMPLKGPCVSPVSVWVVWDVCGAQKVQCGGPGSPFGPPSRLLRPYRGGEGGSEVLIGETTCGPGGPKLHKPSV